MIKAKELLMSEVRKLRYKAKLKFNESEKLEQEAKDLEEQANKID